jgi:integrase
MPTIRKRNERWQAQVRHAGSRPVSKTFQTHADALAWARIQEGKLPKKGGTDSAFNLRTITFFDLIDRYVREITPAKRTAANETIRLRMIQKLPIASVTLAKLRAADFVAFRDERLTKVCGETVRRDLSTLQHVMEIAIREWELPLAENPARLVHKPPTGPSRQRRLTTDDTEKLAKALPKGRSTVFRDVVAFALETAMRRSEVLGLRWSDIDFERGYVRLALTKNGHGRIVPLTQGAHDLLVRRREKPDDPEQVFPITANSVRLAWQRLVRRAKVEDLHFHDLRHEAISRFFEQGLSVPEVALISGHRSPRILLRYAHVFADEVRRKLLNRLGQPALL